MYKEIKVWEKLNEKEAVCYRCLQSIKTEKYFVQSADFFRLPIEKEKIESSEIQFIELFIEDALSSHKKGFESIKEAIENHKEEFKE